MSRPTRRLVRASAVGLVGLLALVAWSVRGSSADGPPTKSLPAATARTALADIQSYAVYKKGGKRIAVAFDWAGSKTPPSVTAYFGRDPAKHPLTPYHPHKVTNHIFIIYMKTHTDRDSEDDPKAAGPGVITVLTTDDTATPVTQPVTVVMIEGGDDTPCDD